MDTFRNWLVLCIFILSSPSFALSQIESQDVQISIITCAPGKDIYSIYGHNAIRIQNKKEGTDLVYNYGTFDFKTPGFIFKFMRGKLPYKLTVADVGSFMAEYQYFERDVREQVLDVDSITKVKIVNYLNNNMLPENVEYKYDFFWDNCATRLRDILNVNITSIQWPALGTNKSYRQIIKEYQAHMPWLDFGVDLIIGARADRKTTVLEETFIPDYLANLLPLVKASENKNLVGQDQKLLTFEPVASSNYWFLSPFFFFTILLLFEINILFRSLQKKPILWANKYDLTWVIIISVVSILMIFMWFGTDHIPTKDNWNILWANPLIILWWFWRQKQNSTFKYLSYFMALCLIISMANSIPSFQFLPQYFNPTIILISLIILIKGVRIHLSNTH